MPKPKVDVLLIEQSDGMILVEVYRHGHNVPSIWNKDIHRSTGYTTNSKYAALRAVSESRTIANVWRRDLHGDIHTDYGVPWNESKGAASEIRRSRGEPSVQEAS